MSFNTDKMQNKFWICRLVMTGTIMKRSLLTTGIKIDIHTQTVYSAIDCCRNTPYLVREKYSNAPTNGNNADTIVAATTLGA